MWMITCKALTGNIKPIKSLPEGTNILEAREATDREALANEGNVVQLWRLEGEAEMARTVNWKLAP